LSSNFALFRKAAALFYAIFLAISLSQVARAELAIGTPRFANSVKEPAPMLPTAVAVPKKRPIVVRSRLSDSELQEAIDFSVALKMRNFAELQARVGMHEIIPLEEMAAKYFPVSASLANSVSDSCQLRYHASTGKPAGSPSCVT